MAPLDRRDRDVRGRPAENRKKDVRPQLEVGTREVREYVHEKNPGGREDVGCQHAEKDVGQAAGLEVPQLARGPHSHLEQEEAEHSLEKTDEEVIVLADNILTLHAADKADQDSAEEQIEPRIEKHFMEQFAGDDAVLLLDQEPGRSEQS